MVSSQWQYLHAHNIPDNNWYSGAIQHALSMHSITNFHEHTCMNTIFCYWEKHACINSKKQLELKQTLLVWNMHMPATTNPTCIYLSIYAKFNIDLNAVT